MRVLNEALWEQIRTECDKAPYSVQCAAYDAIEEHGWYLKRAWPWSVVLRRNLPDGSRQELVIYHGKQKPSGASLAVTPPATEKIKRMADIRAIIAA